MLCIPFQRRYNRSIPDPSHPGSMPTHGVNVGQALQACAWQYKLSASPEWQANATLAIETVWKWHGQSSGMCKYFQAIKTTWLRAAWYKYRCFSSIFKKFYSFCIQHTNADATIIVTRSNWFGRSLPSQRTRAIRAMPPPTFFFPTVDSAEDNLAGLEPSKGTETCASNEAMVSLMVAAGAGATNADVVSMLDRAERIGFNALPGPWRGGQMWELQYHHQVNAFAAPQHEHAEGYDPDSLGYGLPYVTIFFSICFFIFNTLNLPSSIIC